MILRHRDELRVSHGGVDWNLFYRNLNVEALHQIDSQCRHHRGTRPRIPTSKRGMIQGIIQGTTQKPLWEVLMPAVLSVLKYDDLSKVSALRALQGHSGRRVPKDQRDVSRGFYLC